MYESYKEARFVFERYDNIKETIIKEKKLKEAKIPQQKGIRDVFHNLDM